MSAQIKTPEEIAKHVLDHSPINAYGSATVTASGSATVTAYGSATLYDQRNWATYRENQGWESTDLERCAEWSARMALGAPCGGRMTRQLVRYLALTLFVVLILAGAPIIINGMLALNYASYVLNTILGIAWGATVTTICLFLWMKGDE